MVDTLINVRAANAPESVGWATARVRSCRAVEGGHRVGCQFVQALPWNTLLLFG